MFVFEYVIELNEHDDDWIHEDGCNIVICAKGVDFRKPYNNIESGYGNINDSRKPFNMRKEVMVISIIT